MTPLLFEDGRLQEIHNRLLEHYGPPALPQANDLLHAFVTDEDRDLA
jgi:hypothetical protein